MRFSITQPLAATIAGATAAWMLIWSFLSGGVIDRLARDRRTRTHGFFAACGLHFWRFLRLGLFAWLIYAFLFGWIHGWIFDDAYAALIARPDVRADGVAHASDGLPRCSAALLVFFNVIFDYARIRIVVEDRRSAIGALAAGARFVRRHFGQVVALYLLNGVAFLLCWRRCMRSCRPVRRATGWRCGRRSSLGQALHRRTPLPEAGVLCFADRAVPVGSWRTPHTRRAAGGVAGFAGGRGDHQRRPGTAS